MITPEMMAKSGSEDAHQQALFCWSALPDVRVKYPDLAKMFAVPNGGKRDVVTAGKLKAAGVKAGVWDIFLAVPKYSFSMKRWYHGLFLEMKVDNNKLSPKQKDFQTMLDGDYAFAVAYSWDEAKDFIIKYLGLQ